MKLVYRPEDQQIKHLQVDFNSLTLCNLLSKCKYLTNCFHFPEPTQSKLFANEQLFRLDHFVDKRNSLFPLYIQRKRK